MDSCFVENPVQEMLSCGIVALLRTALDEREESVVFAATHCLASLIAPQVSPWGLFRSNIEPPSFLPSPSVNYK
jgi:hypothetical protein